MSELVSAYTARQLTKEARVRLKREHGEQQEKTYWLGRAFVDKHLPSYIEQSIKMGARKTGHYMPNSQYEQGLQKAYTQGIIDGTRAAGYKVKVYRTSPLFGRIYKVEISW